MTDAPDTVEHKPGSPRVLGNPSSAAAVFFGLLAVVLLLYHATVAQIVGTWDADGGYSHGWLILGLVIWIMLDQRRTLFAVVSGSRWPALILGLGAAAAWLAAGLISVQLVQQLALLGMIVLLPLMLFGWRGGLALAGALALLVFTIPMWEATIPLLQGMTVRAVDFCLDLSRVTAYIVGNTVTIPSGQFRIVQGCSGMHFFVSGFALAAVYSYLYLRTWTHRIALVLVTLAVAILANWIRVYVVILAGYLTEMQHYLVQQDHYFFGWILFGVSLIPVFFLATWMERREERAGLGQPSVPVGDESLASTRMPGYAILALLVILGGTAGNFVFSAERATDAWCPRILPELPGWTLEPLADESWRPDFHGESVALSGRYARYGRDDVELVVWLMFYQKQAQGQELIFYANRPFDPEHWQQLERTVATAGDSVPAVSLTLEGRDESRRRLSYWYEVGGRPTHQRWAAKGLQIPALLSGRADAALIAVSSACDDSAGSSISHGNDGCETADAAIEEFLRAAAPAVTRAPVAELCDNGL